MLEKKSCLKNCTTSNLYAAGGCSTELWPESCGLPSHICVWLRTINKFAMNTVCTNYWEWNYQKTKVSIFRCLCNVFSNLQVLNYHAPRGLRAFCSSKNWGIFPQDHSIMQDFMARFELLWSLLQFTMILLKLPSLNNKRYSGEKSWGCIM